MPGAKRPNARLGARHFVVAVAWAAGVPTASATPPHVVSVTPAPDSAGVDPATKEIIVVFDQPMANGYSVTHGLGTGPRDVPGDAGAARWPDDHTFVDPIRLRADRDYGVSFNDGAFQNFTNAAGEPLVPYPMRFSTAATATTPRAAANARLLARLKRAIDEDYSHRDIRGVDWDARFREFTPRLLGAPSVRAFGRTAAELLVPAHDAHMALWLRRGLTEWNYLPFPMPVANVNPDALPKLVPGWTSLGDGAVATGRFPDGVGFIAINEWERATQAALPDIYAAIQSADPLRGLIIDVRANEGGSELIGQKVAGCFVRKPTPYANVRARQNGSWLGPFQNEVAPNPACAAFPAERVAVLEGPTSMSADESFLKMMKLAGAAIVGQTSLGSSGLPLPHRLGHGLVLMVPSIEDNWPDGTPVEGVGVSPTVEVEATAADLANRDPVLDAALALLRRSGG